MKKQLLTIISFLLLSYCSFSQLDNGTYKYENPKMKLILVLTGDGQVVESVTINNLETGKVETGKGEFVLVNTEEGKSNAWYQFTTEICNYEFDFGYINPTIQLSSYDCKNGIKPANYILEEK